MDNSSFEKNLNLKNQNGEYNLLGELLADRNNIPLIFVKFHGINKASISETSDFGYGCLLTSYTKIKNRLIAENICVSDTTVRPRVDKFLYDIDCVNEAVLNALVHRLSEASDKRCYEKKNIMRSRTRKFFFFALFCPLNFS